MISCHFPTDNRFAPKIKEAGILLSSALCVGFWIRIRASRSPVGCSFFSAGDGAILHAFGKPHRSQNLA